MTRNDHYSRRSSLADCQHWQILSLSSTNDFAGKISTLADWQISKLARDYSLALVFPVEFRFKEYKKLSCFASLAFFCFQYAYKSKLLARLKTKKASLKASFLYSLAENVGFEPTVPCGTTVFKTAAIDHSANSPGQKYINFQK